MDAPSPSVTNGDPGDRDAAGRWVAGNTAGRGNPNLRRISALRHRLLAAVRDETIDAIGAKLSELAEGGDLEAIKVLLSYTIGRPAQAVELMGPGGESLGVNFYQLQVMLLDALRDHPAARVAVASRLRELARADDAGQPGDGA